MLKGHFHIHFVPAASDYVPTVVHAAGDINILYTACDINSQILKSHYVFNNFTLKFQLTHCNFLYTAKTVLTAVSLMKLYEVFVF